MAYLRAKGMECYGVGPMTDSQRSGWQKNRGRKKAIVRKSFFLPLFFCQLGLAGGTRPQV
jgi:hypothetical protein